MGSVSQSNRVIITHQQVQRQIFGIHQQNYGNQIIQDNFDNQYNQNNQSDEDIQFYQDNQDNEDEDEEESQENDTSFNNLIIQFKLIDEFIQLHEQEVQRRKQEELLWKQFKMIEQLVQAHCDYVKLNNFLEDLEKSQKQNNNSDQIELNISLFYQKKYSQSIDYPCKHAKCQTVATMNSKGEVNCKKGCPSFTIKDALFDVTYNKVFNKIENINIVNCVSIQTSIEMAQILKDSMARSQMNETDKNEFCKNFSSVLCLQFINIKKKQ
ncbi:unnamed protein product [Paramecium primaurelia]|uniref:Uncharacterized protein n=1 Tax=Paramecium primaurelia TaxID=5886 RepID=A0A8S1QDG6_PARPR|nr:unnamed protein product [Paramecium primaurelia]